MSFSFARGETQVPIAPHVVIGFDDISSAGVRLVWGLQGKNTQHHAQQESISCDGLQLPTCTRPSYVDGPADAFVHITTLSEKEGSDPLVTFICLSSRMRNHTGSFVAKALIELCAACDITQLTIAAAMHFTSQHPVHTHSNRPNTQVPASLPVLSSKTTVKDSFLSALLHFAELSEVPCLLLAAPGNRANRTSFDDGTSQVIAALGEAVCAITPLQFSLEQCLKVELPNTDLAAAHAGSDTRNVSNARGSLYV
jgi:hypothetical protein